MHEIYTFNRFEFNVASTDIATVFVQYCRSMSEINLISLLFVSNSQSACYAISPHTRSLLCRVELHAHTFSRTKKESNIANQIIFQRSVSLNKSSAGHPYAIRARQHETIQIDRRMKKYPRPNDSHNAPDSCKCYESCSFSACENAANLRRRSFCS